MRLRHIIKLIKCDGLKFTFDMRFRCARCGRLRIRGGWYDLCENCDKIIWSGNSYYDE